MSNDDIDQVTVSGDHSSARDQKAKRSPQEESPKAALAPSEQDPVVRSSISMASP